MAFDRKHYKEIKKFVSWTLNNPPWCYTGKCPFDWAKVHVKLVAQCVHSEDYEGAKATSDAIREFLNQFLKEPIKEDALLNLPEYEAIELRGIICPCDKHGF